MECRDIKFSQVGEYETSRRLLTHPATYSNKNNL